MKTVSEERFLFARYAVITLKNQWPRVAFHGSAGRAVLRFHEAYSKGALPPSVTPIAW